MAVSVVTLILSACSVPADNGHPNAAVSPEEVRRAPRDDVEARTWQELVERGLEPFAENYRRSFGTDPPTAQLVYYIDPREYGRVMAECMRSEGWPAVETSDGGLGFNEAIPDEQAQAQQDSWFRCMYMYPVHPMYDVPFDDRQLRVIYDYYVDELIPCLAAEDQVLEAPTFETFVGRWESPSPWTPYGELVTQLPPDERERVRQACPENLPFDELFGTG